MYSKFLILSTPYLHELIENYLQEILNSKIEHGKTENMPQ